MAKPKKRGELDIPTHIMDDLCSRFVINSDRKLDPVQVFDILECAHWHYVDFYCMQVQPPLPKCNHKTFCKQIFMYLSELNHFLADFDNLHQQWQDKKRSTPSYGGIILSPNYTHVLMVQGFTNKTTWGFPKGKLEVGESGRQCAIREIEEETGLEVAEKIREEMSITNWIQDRFHKLYIIPDVPLKSEIKAKLRKEIRDYKWIPVESLPVHRNDLAPQQVRLDATNFFNVIPFVKPLRKWIDEQIGICRAMPASQFTAKGRRRGKGKDMQRKQGPLGPDGDAPTSKDSHGHSSRQSQVAKSLGDQFDEVLRASLGQHGKHIGILSREGDGSEYEDLQDISSSGQTILTEDQDASMSRLRLDEFHSEKMRNFKFDVEAILSVFQW